MHIKRFEAPTLPEAVARVKEALGPDALILSTRKVRRDGGRLGWLGRPVVEVVAAVDRDRAAAARRAAASAEREPERTPRGRPDPSWQGLALTRALVDPLEAELRALRSAVAGLAAARAPAPAPPPPADDPVLREELAQLRVAVRALEARLAEPPPAAPAAPSAAELEIAAARAHAEALVRAERERERTGAARSGGAAADGDLEDSPERTGEGEPAPLAPDAEALARRLEAHGFAPAHARALAVAMDASAQDAAEEGESSRSGRRGRRRRRRRARGARAPDSPASPKPITAGQLARALAQRLDARLVPPRPEPARGVSLFVGAPGVGKTTSLAKIAAREGTRADDTAVVSADGFRVGAEEQLRHFAGRLGVPFVRAVSPEDLAERVDRLGRARVLVDTAGRSRRDVEALGELVRCRDALGDRARVHLVLSATTRESDLRAEVARFAPLRPESLVVTRLDEADRPVHVANLLLDEELPPLAWLGTGQCVPEDLAVPDPAELAARVLEGLR